jgi:hypothetical protein
MDERSDADVGADHGSPAKRLTSQPSGSLVPASRWLLAGLGVFFLAAAWGLGFSATGTELHYGGALSTSSPSTANFWLAYLLLIVPGALMVGGWAGPAAHAWRMHPAWSSASASTQRLLWILLAAVAILAADLGQRWIMLGFPLTDDEWVARFGGQVLAHGELGISLSEAEAANPQRFTVTLLDGRVTSFEWLGGQLAWALGEWSGTGGLVFAVCAGLTFWAVALACTFHPRVAKAWPAVVLFLCSPMAVAVSVMLHTHTVARCFVALAILCWMGLARRGGRAWALGLGLAVGGAMLTRPVESAVLLLPLAAALVWDALRGRNDARSHFLAAILGGLGPLLLLLWYQSAITGNPFEIPRFHESASGDALAALTLTERFGSNLSHNLMMLCLWFAGPFGIVLVTAGFTGDRTTVLLGSGVALLLLLALAHPYTGIHMVGPINYTEALPSLVLIAAVGASRLEEWWRSVAHDRPWLPSAALIGLLISGLWFNVQSLSGLRAQAQIHDTLVGGVERELDRLGVGRAIVLAPRYIHVWHSIPVFRERSTFVYDWPRPTPDGAGPVVFLTLPRTPAQVADALRTWPDRAIFVLQLMEEWPYLRLAPLDTATATE